MGSVLTEHKCAKWESEPFSNFPCPPCHSKTNDGANPLKPLQLFFLFTCLCCPCVANRSIVQSGIYILDMKKLEIICVVQLPQIQKITVRALQYWMCPCNNIRSKLAQRWNQNKINSPDVLTMRSGGGVLRMKHLICPFSPCKACWVCVLEIVGGPEKEQS